MSQTMKENQNNYGQWEYTELDNPTPQRLNDYGRGGWEAYSVARRVSTYGVSTTIYLKRRVQKGGAK